MCSGSGGAGRQGDEGDRQYRDTAGDYPRAEGGTRAAEEGSLRHHAVPASSTGESISSLVQLVFDFINNNLCNQ